MSSGITFPNKDEPATGQRSHDGGEQPDEQEIAEQRRAERERLQRELDEHRTAAELQQRRYADTTIQNLREEISHLSNRLVNTRMELSEQRAQQRDAVHEERERLRTQHEQETERLERKVDRLRDEKHEQDMELMQLQLEKRLGRADGNWTRDLAEMASEHGDKLVGIVQQLAGAGAASGLSAPALPASSGDGAAQAPPPELAGASASEGDTDAARANPEPSSENQPAPSMQNERDELTKQQFLQRFINQVGQVLMDRSRDVQPLASELQNDLTRLQNESQAPLAFEWAVVLNRLTQFALENEMPKEYVADRLRPVLGLVDVGAISDYSAEEAKAQIISLMGGDAAPKPMRELLAHLIEEGYDALADSAPGDPRQTAQAL